MAVGAQRRGAHCQPIHTQHTGDISHQTGAVLRHNRYAPCGFVFGHFNVDSRTSPSSLEQVQLLARQRGITFVGFTPQCLLRSLDKFINQVCAPLRPSRRSRGLGIGFGQGSHEVE